MIMLNKMVKKLTYMTALSSICTSGTNFLRNNKGTNLTVGNMACKLFYYEMVFFQWKANTEYWLFIPPLTHMNF